MTDASCGSSMSRAVRPRSRATPACLSTSGYRLAAAGVVNMFPHGSRRVDGGVRATVRATRA
jgi:hypothetical protein